MPTLEAIRAGLAAFIAGEASETEQRLVGDALRAGRLVLAEGERSVGVGGSADGATIITGDGNVVLMLDAAAARAVRALLGPPIPRQLPSDVADFTGREREIAALERALGGDGGRAAIGGMGGVGKTALAVHVARGLMDRYPDGQIVVDLKGTTEPLSPSAAMGQVVVAFDPGRKLPDDAAGLAGLYRSLLSGKRLLILFDNAADAAQVGELLPAPPGAAIVTSRRKVVLPGLLRVPLDVLAPEEADALLLQIIGEECASAEERAALAERCGHLPLALRVAGTFLVSYPDWGVAEYLTELANERERLRRLRIEGDALLNVSAVLGPSLRQLAHNRPELVVRWRMLAVFAGGFDREAAAAVWAVAPAEARDGLSPLVERSMLLFDDAKQRYRLHDLMRDLALGAAEPLSEEEERRLEEARDRHSAHYQRLLARANTLFEQGGEGVAAGLARFDQERANIEAGWRWLLGQAADDEAVARRRSDYVAFGYAVLPLRQHPREWIEWLETALAAARRLRDRQGEGRSLDHLGNCYHILGDYHRAIDHYEQFIAIAREIGDRKGEGVALANLGSCYHILGDYHRAIDHYEQSLAIAREIGGREGEGIALGHLGNCYNSLGDYHRAIDHYEQSLAIAREIGDRQGEGFALSGLGSCYYILGDYRRAIDHAEQRLAIAREIGHRYDEDSSLGNLGSCYYSLGDYHRAIDHHEQSLAIAREIGDRQGEGRSLGNLGNCYYSLGDYHRAIDHYEQSLAIAREIGDRQGEGAALVSLGDVYMDTGRLVRACEYFQDASKITDATGDRQNQHEARFGLALARLYAGGLGAAREAIDGAREYDYPQNTAAAWTATGIIQLRQGEPVAASKAFACGLAEADGLLARSGQNFSALDTKGLALCGLALCEDEGHLTAGEGAFRAARKITQAKGVVARVLNQFDALALADMNGILSPARKAAEGQSATCIASSRK